MSEEQAVQGLTFDDLDRLTDREIQLLLREVDTKDCALAMKGANQGIQGRIYANVSERVAGMITKEMAFLGSVPPGRIEEVQFRIVQTVLQLIAAGQIRPVETLLKEPHLPAVEKAPARTFLEKMDWFRQESRRGPGIDLSTVVGLLLGILVVAFGVRQGLSLLRPVPALWFVLLGAVAAVLIAHSWGDLFGLARMAWKAILTAALSPRVCIEMLVCCGEQARREGILSLEQALDRLPSLFFQRGMKLAIDGVEPKTIQQILGGELEAMEERHRAGQAVVATAGAGGALFGALGLALGMILSAGRTAFIPLFWGGLLWGLCFALRVKLRGRAASERQYLRIVMTGIFEIQSGTNPAMMEQQLFSLLPPRERRAQGASK